MEKDCGSQVGGSGVDGSGGGSELVQRYEHAFVLATVEESALQRIPTGTRTESGCYKSAHGWWRAKWLAKSNSLRNSRGSDPSA